MSDRSAAGRAWKRGRVAPGSVLRRTLRWLALATIALIALLAIEALIAIITVPDDGYRAPSPAPRAFGTADAERPRLRYVVLGDSTATGRGAPYERGIAVATARHLAARRPVTLTNLAVSGARLRDVRRDQLPAAVRSRPDVVLVAAGANDVTGLTRLRSVRADLEEIVDRLRAARCDVAIVVTASPDIGVVPRLAQPLRAVAGRRTDQVNGAIEDVVRERGLVLAPIAARTGPLFRADRSLFAADDFHPSAAGYATWVPVIEAALDRALVRRAGGHDAGRCAHHGVDAGRYLWILGDGDELRSLRRSRVAAPHGARVRRGRGGAGRRGARSHEVDPVRHHRQARCAEPHGNPLSRALRRRRQ